MTNLANVLEAPARILVVDDNEAGLYVKMRILKMAGHEILDARTGMEALTLIETERPDIAVLDVRLPDMNGMDICRQLKARNAAVAILQTSATFVRGQDRATGLDAGADAYLTEPLEPDELLATVNALLRMRRAENQLRTLNDTLELRVAERTRELAQANEQLSQEIVDRRKAEESLRQAQKMEAVGQLTGGIAHDFNNLLTVIYGGLETIQRKLPTEDERLARAIEHSLLAAKRAASLTQRLLAFARRQPLDPKPTQINELIEGMLELLHRTLGENVKLETHLADDLNLTEVDNNQLESALLNLAVNARDAMPNGGALSIETANIYLEDASIKEYLEIKSGPYVMIAVGDTGIGMERDVVEKAFEPFFTTKPVGQGTGLGLSQVYGFVKQSGGHVKIYSEPGAGATLKIYLPKLDKAGSVELAHRSEPSEPALGNETVLVVEDNDGVRAYSVDALRELGYRVLEAGDAHTALDILRRRTGIALLFTDIGLPGAMNGHELAQAAKATAPDLKVLHTTGYARDALLRDGRLQAGIKLLSKPFTYAELAAKLREVLGG